MTPCAPNPAEHLRIAHWVVTKHLARRPWLWHLVDDLTGAAMEGLVRAARDFDPERGEWKSLAFVSARYAVLSEIRRIAGATRTPNKARIAPVVSIDEELAYGGDVMQAHELRGSSRDEHANAPRTLLDVLADDGADPEREAAASEAPALLGSLPELEAGIVARRIAGDTLEEIGEDLGLTRERIRQIEARAMARLRRRHGGGE